MFADVYGQARHRPEIIRGAGRELERPLHHPVAVFRISDVDVVRVRRIVTREAHQPPELHVDGRLALGDRDRTNVTREISTTQRVVISAIPERVRSTSNRTFQRCASASTTLAMYEPCTRRHWWAPAGIVTVTAVESATTAVKVSTNHRAR